MLLLNSLLPSCRLGPLAAMSPLRQSRHRRKRHQRKEFSFAANDPIIPASLVWLTLLALTSLRTTEAFSTYITTGDKTPARFDTSLACQLLGVNSRAPHDFTSSFQKLARRGGDVDIHSHGWGLAYYCDKSKALCNLRDPKAAASSPVAKSISKLKSQNMISHIRYATVGAVCVDNVHPFTRQLWDVDFVFAHNGDVPMFQGKGRANVWLGGTVPRKTVFQPVGDTDSEALFCAILNSLSARFDSMPPLPILHDYINTLCKEVVSHDSRSTILNFLLAFGEQTQIVYSWPGRREGSTTWNGLHYKSEEQGDTGRIAVIATKPLDESGEKESDSVEMKRGECLLFEKGEVHSAPEDSYQAELFALNLFDDSFLQWSQHWGVDTIAHLSEVQ